MTITSELILFFILAAVAVGAAVGMLFSRNAVHSALFLVLNFAVVSVFFLMLAAPFIAMVQVTVYAGAIMVLFLFVIMLLGAELLRQGGTALPWQTGLAGLLAVGFIAALAYVVFLRAGPLTPIPPVDVNYGDPVAIGTRLFQDYLLPFELTSFLLLVAMIGAVVLTRDRQGRPVVSRTTQPGQPAAPAGAPAAAPAPEPVREPTP
ncbi:MAG: NADH-quinone oxidoreductase subunit J [Anaerolineales bacterium]|nr:NADH-quinone oxidoreductase subunit J [Anaerolineales bacterium]